MSDTHNATSRNDSLTRGAGVIAAAAAISLLAPQRASALTLNFDGIPGTGDIKVLNYALALEDFEAALYQAALAKLPTVGAAAGDPLLTVVTEFAQVETDHAGYLRAAITSAGGAPIGKFKYDTSRIDTATSPQPILELLLQVEATGVRAYLGAVPFFAVGSPYLQTAAAIQATEARHTTVLTLVRNLVYGTTAAVAPLTQDGNETSKLNYDTIVYSAVNPNEGYKSLDVTLSPNAVLTAVGPFFTAAA